MPHLLRACIRVMRHAESGVVKEFERTRLSRPPNEEPAALADFERRLARTMLIAFKKARRMR